MGVKSMIRFLTAGLLTAGLLAFGLSGPVSALDKPQGKVVLTVTGKITETNGSAGAEFDLAMLDALPGRTARMKTPWTEGETTFSGPLCRAILAAAGANGTAPIVVRALNDYAADVPLEDCKNLDMILATKINGEPIPVRAKGPLFVIYPFDKDPSLYNEKYFARSVWQVKSIEIR
ncbi:molybdopterin-dependent oxidoreductase [Prosthecodimorpha staleyi]|nr:molybdopterin-dependent oxidoreductase [Prosthecodimorpha staleyi]